MWCWLVSVPLGSFPTAREHRSPRTVESSHWRLPETSHDWWTVKELPGFSVRARSLCGSELTDTIPAVCDLLDHEEMAVMKAALVLLSDLPVDPKVISSISNALSQSHDRTRSDLYLLTLGRLGHKPVATPLSEVAHRRTDRYGQLAAVYLGRLGERSVDDVLIGLLHGEDREMRVAAAAALNGTQSPDAISPLIANIKEYGPFGDTLVSIGETAVPALVRLLGESEDAILAARAAEVLGKIGGEEALHALLEALQQVNQQLPGEEIEQALEDIGDQSALKPLFNAYTRGYYSNYRTSYIVSFGQPARTLALEYLSSTVDELRGGAAEVLAELAERQDVPHILAHLHDDSWRVRWYLVMALQRLRDPRSVEELIECLDDPDWRVKEYAAQALADFGGQPGLGALQKAIGAEEDRYMKFKLRDLLKKKQTQE